ncbi:TPA: AraC family transcriptional regulator [Streptococcus suis]|nr:AraC family transcriptional regulator [Streptococcus suis]HEM5235173.1 AraC family transcriptional regulator [Streptococcus suis]HEM5241488.1 AraC family transcriptional regulator [Streptococcus suis]
MLTGGKKYEFFSDIETDAIDLTIDFFGYDDCNPGYSYGPSIRDNFILHFVTKGKGTFEYNGNIHHLSTGDLFLLKPDELTFYQADKKEPWSYYWIGLSGSKIKDYFQLSSIYHQAILLHSKNTNTQGIGELIKDTVHQANTMKTTAINQLYILSKLFEILFQLGNISPTTELPTYSPQYKLYLDARKIIETRYTLSELSVSSTAQLLNINRSYLTTIFKQFSNQTPKDYLLQLRMKRAKELILQTLEPIQIIAYSVGYSDPLYFSKAFKNYFHMSPTDFRNAQKNKD